METLNHTPMPALPLHGRRFQWGPARIAFLLLALPAGGVGLMGRMVTQDPTPAGAQGHAEVACLVTDCQPATQVSPPAGSLQEILAQPDFIPTHKHPFLGRLAPDFELADLEGKAWNLREVLAGGPVALVFYHSPCDLCVRQLLESNNDLPLFREAGARLVAISADSPKSMRRRFDQYGPFDFPVLLDPENKVAQAYQVFTPAQDGKMAGRLLHGTFIIDRHGTVQWVNVGDAPFRRNSALVSFLAKMEGRLPSVQPEP